jgi:hypothetical protein
MGAVNNATVTSWVLCNVATMLPLLVGFVSFCNCDRGQSLPRGVRGLTRTLAIVTAACHRPRCARWQRMVVVIRSSKPAGSSGSRNTSAINSSSEMSRMRSVRDRPAG